MLEPLATDRPGDPKTTIKRLYRMRDGREVSIDTRVYRNKWEALVQGQRREEEIAQFAGHIRTYHKLHLSVDPARWQTLWLVSTVIPEGTILDDIVHVHDLAVFNVLMDGPSLPIIRMAKSTLSSCLHGNRGGT